MSVISHADCATFQIFITRIGIRRSASAKSLGISSPASRVMMCYRNSLVFPRRRGSPVLSFSLHPFRQAEPAGISVTKAIIMSVFRVSRPRNESFRKVLPEMNCEDGKRGH